MGKKVIVLVSNDLEFDQRVAKTCNTLLEQGYDITLIGRKLPNSHPIDRPYKTRRFELIFKKGALFYAMLNFRLFFYLLFQRFDIVLANDLDTLLPAYLISKWKRKQLVYDSHEYFTEAEGLTGRGFQKNVWERIEKFIFPKLKFVYTVNQSIAKIYSDKYGVEVGVVRNIAKLGPIPVASRANLKLPENKKIIVLQGAYIDPDRGGKEAVLAMEQVNNALLLVIGSGREMPLIKELALRPELKEKVLVFPKLPYSELQKYTVIADLGLSLDKPLHLNYTLSLPNKLFDYIHHGVPVVGSNLVELNRIISTYNIGWILDEVSPANVAKVLNEVLANEKDLKEKKANCMLAREQLNWQNEEKVIIEIFKKASAS